MQGVFDGHATIIGALHELGVTGQLLHYIQAFLSDRTLRVRVGGTLSDPCGVFSGVPQGSVLSPFYGSPTTSLRRRRTRCDRPSTRTSLFLRASIQTAVHAVNEYLANIGLQLSTEKTEALMVHPGATCSRFEVPPLTMRGSPFPWPKSVRYLGLQIDCRLNFNSAVSHLCKESRRVASAPFSREDGVARHILR